MAASLQDDGKVSLTVSKTFGNVYYRVFKRGEDNSEQPVTSVNDGRVMAMVGSEKFTAAPDGLLVISEYYARMKNGNNTLTVNIPGLQAGTYIVREYGSNGNEIGTAQTISVTEEDGTIPPLQVEKTVTATPDTFHFKVMASGHSEPVLPAAVVEFGQYAVTVDTGRKHHGRHLEGAGEHGIGEIVRICGHAREQRPEHRHRNPRGLRRPFHRQQYPEQ